jgi:hypothetical protein
MINDFAAERFCCGAKNAPDDGIRGFPIAPRILIWRSERLRSQEDNTMRGLSMRLVVCALLGLGVSPARADEVNDFPTSARADYVFGCMKANGETRQSLDQCSCSVDVVASLVPYDRYVTAETVLSMAQVQGNLGGQFRTSEQANSALNDLRRAQAEAEVRCF